MASPASGDLSMAVSRPDPGSFAAELEQRAARRFVRWNGKLWRTILDGPEPMLAEALAAAETPEVETAALHRTYLELAAEGIGLGYLVPTAASSSTTLLTLCWTELIPLLLADTLPDQRAETRAQLWNLCENLESLPEWWARLFAGALRRMKSFAELEATVQQIASRVSNPPRGTLDPTAAIQQHHWFWLRSVDPRFLPGRIQFLSGSVAFIHDRLRDGRATGAASAIAISLADSPEILGPVQVPPCEQPNTAFRPQPDLRVTGMWDTAVNPHRALVTFLTSQFVLVVAPGVGV